MSSVASQRQELFGRIGRDIGPMPRGSDRLAFEAKIWRAVITRAPSLSVVETVSLTEQIMEACVQTAALPDPPKARRGRRAPVEAV